MSVNPFTMKPKALGERIVSLKELSSKPYSKNAVDPYTKLRIILMNGTEFESVWCQHQFSRHCPDNELRREVATIRRIEQQQQKRISSLKPIGENILEHTIGYEMLAVDLTIALAINEKSPLVKKALDFALLEDFDHLYRYANLLEEEQGVKAEKLVGKYVELMPGRPTVAEHRFPHDDIKPHIGPDADLLTKLNVGIITAAEQQTMNYYMNVGGFHDTEAGRKLYSEIAMIEEQHVSHYGSLKDTGMTWLEGLLMHEYTECYLYYSCYSTETDDRIKLLWEELFEDEVSHLHKAAELLAKYENKDWRQLIPNGNFPKLLEMKPQKEYLRKVLKSVGLTANLDDYIEVDQMPDNADFFYYQDRVVGDGTTAPSHKVIRSHITQFGQDYRYEESPHPIEALRDRKKDNITIAR